VQIEGSLTVEKLIYGGDGLSRSDRRVILTPFVLPGEKIDAEVVKAKKDLIEAKPVGIIEPSAHRVPAPCPYFGRCGGCHYQHADYQYQLEQKREILRELLTRARVTPPEEIALVSGEPWTYRNRSQFHVINDQLGYLEAGSHRLVPIEQCPISSPRLNEAITALVGMTKDPRFPNFIRSLELFTNETEVQVNVIETLAGRYVARSFFDWCETTIPGAITGPLEYGAIGHRFRVSHRSFFQVNRYLIPALVEAALGDVEGESVLELYAGVGLFSIPLSKRFKKVTAVESGKAALEDLEHNTRAAERHVIGIRSQADLYLETVRSRPDFMLADPPRAGLGKTVTKQIVRLRPKHLAIVSCDPATHARDLQELLAGGYVVSKLTLIDLFPQTFHIETVTHLTHPG
jgi:23S rRNA (uracil1939-C5)-methyltransferase